jgi:hypothetical protein
VTFRLDPTPTDHTGGFVAGDTRIHLGSGISVTVADVVERQHRGVETRTDALDVDGTVRHVKVTMARRLDGDAATVTVGLDDGTQVHCSPGQLFLGSAGEWLPAKELAPGTVLFSVGHARSVDHVTPREHHAVYEIRVEHLHNLVHPSGIVLHD